MTYGLTPQGFIVKPLDAILSEIETAQRAAIDPLLDTSAESVIGMLNGIVATQIRQLWELGGVVYSARDPGGATFETLDALAAITGTKRAAASKGSVGLTLTVAAHTTIPAGKIAAVLGDPTNQWVTTADAVNSTGAPANVTVNAQAVNAGKILANAGTITVISSPTTGWTAVTNPSDATPGADAEGDPALRIRREEELSGTGNATLDAMRADLLQLKFQGQQMITACLVDENAGDVPDALGRPPHSVDVMVQLASFFNGLSPSDQAAFAAVLFAELWAIKPGGIDFAPGGNVGTVVDSNGITRTVTFSFPNNVPIFVTAGVQIDPAHWDGTGTALKNAIVAFGAGQKFGQPVIWSRLNAYIIDNVPGVLDVTSLLIGVFTGARYAANVTVGARDLATFDTSNITVTTS